MKEKLSEIFKDKKKIIYAALALVLVVIAIIILAVSCGKSDNSAAAVGADAQIGTETTGDALATDDANAGDKTAAPNASGDKKDNSGNDASNPDSGTEGGQAGSSPSGGAPAGSSGSSSAPDSVTTETTPADLENFVTITVPATDSDLEEVTIEVFVPTTYSDLTSYPDDASKPASQP